MYIVIDESGTLPDSNDSFIVLTAVVAHTQRELRTVINTERRLLKQRKITVPSELKFYTASNRLRHSVLVRISHTKGIRLYVLVVNKEERSISDSPVNYGILIWQLLIELFSMLSKSSHTVVIDRHFNKVWHEKQLIEFLSSKFPVSFKQMDSQQNTEISIADFVAAAVLYKYSRKNTDYFNDIRKSIVVEKVINWSLLKSKLYVPKKKSA